MTIKTEGNMKIITADENKILVFGDVKCTMLYTPLTFDESQIDEVEYVVEVVEPVEPSEIEQLNERIYGLEEMIVFISLSSF